MKTRNLCLVLLLALVFPARAFALSAPTYDPVPAQVDANTYTFKFNTSPGATISVLGGPADIAPITDGVGNPLDGKVEIMVGLAQNQSNVFSVVASLNGETSGSITITIKEAKKAKTSTSSPGSAVPAGDVTPPPAPALDVYPATVNTLHYTFSGSSEADANIYVRDDEDFKVGSTRATSQGLFSVRVTLKRNKENHLYFSAEDAAGNEGSAAEVKVVVPKVVEKETVTEPGVTEQKKPEFVDIRQHWAEEYIKKLYTEKVVSGKNDYRFDPNGEITRAELTKIAMNAFGHKVQSNVSAKPFRDVSADSWFAPYIEAAKEKGIVSGYSDGFHPNEAVNRAAALKILFEASGLAQIEVATNFNDVPDGAWFYPYVASAVAHGIVAGYADGTFRPGKPITRAEVSKIVVKIKELVNP